VGAICGASDPPLEVVSFGTSYAGSNPHGPDENIRLEDFMQSVKFFGRVIHHLGQQVKHVKSGVHKSSTALVLSKG
jgi:di/tripeptidase